MEVSQLIWMVPSFVILSWLGKRVPLDVKGFAIDLKKYAGLLLVFLIHYAIAHGAAQFLVVAGLSGKYGGLILLWQIAIPLLALAYYIVVRKKKICDLRYEVALGAAFYTIATYALIAIVLRYDMGWVDTQAAGSGVGVLQVVLNVMLGLAYYAYVSVAEELFFRVTVFELLDKWGVTRETTVVVLTGMAFGLMHITDYFWATTHVGPMGAITNVLSVTVMGLIFGAIYARRRNFLHVTFLHWWVWVANIGARIVAGMLYYFLS